MKTGLRLTTAERRACDRMMEDNPSIPGPLVVSGVGGSGTRVLAEVMRALGGHMGCVLNQASDNQWVTLLFKSLPWVQSLNLLREGEITERVQILRHAMLGPWTPTERQMTVLRYCKETCFNQRIALEPLLQGTPPELLREARFWGWKEPNTHLFLPQLLLDLPTGRFVHLVRHGLDMAFSDNLSQSQNWRFLFPGESAPEEPAEVAALRFWIFANRRVQAYAQSFPERVRLVRFEDLCAQPLETVRSLVAWSKLPIDPERIAAAAALIQAPASVGRHTQYDLRAFPEDLLRELSPFGYDGPRG